MKYSHKKAFSLIEILGVLLIIGVVMASILGSRKIVSISRLSAARNLTSFAPVNSIEGLVLWLDATSKEAFDDGADEDGTSISNWYDINQRSLEKYDVSTSSPNQPTYRREAIHKLPALEFDGSNDYLTGSNLIEVTGNPDITVFIVANVVEDGGGDSQRALQIGPATGSNAGLSVAFDLDGSFRFNNGNQVFSSQKGFPVIVTYRRNMGDQYNEGEIWANGFKLSQTSESSGSNKPVIDPEEIIVGAGKSSAGSIYGPIDGYMGEVIVFNNSLTDEEIEDVNTYLSKKWKIDLDSN